MEETKDLREVFIGCGITREQSRRNYEHYEEIKNKVNIIDYSYNYGRTTYNVKPLDENLTLDEIALVCDKGNLCFGYDSRKYSDGSYKIDIYTD